MCNRFQIVGSLLRPSVLLGYKHQIEHRDDIQYPFYQDFQGYEQCEAEAIQAVVDKVCCVIRAMDFSNGCVSKCCRIKESKPTPAVIMDNQ